MNLTVIRMDSDEIEERYQYTPSVGDILITWRGRQRWYSPADAAEALYNMSEERVPFYVALWNGNYLIEMG